MSKLEMILRELEDQGYKPKKEGNNYRSACPSHNGDNERTLTIFDNGDDKVGFHCHKGCNYEEIIQAIGIDFKPIQRDLIPSWIGKSEENRYPYKNQNGKTLYYKLRLKGKKFRYSHMYQDKEYSGRGSYQSILYNLPNVIKADEILLVEGEKDADNLNDLGYIATTKDSTSRLLNNNELDSLKGKEIILFYDNDAAGKESLKNNINQLGEIVRSLKVIDLDSDTKGYDISDYIEEKKAAKKDIDKLIATAENIPVGKYRNLYDFSSYDDYIKNIKGNQHIWEYENNRGKKSCIQGKLREYLTKNIPLIRINNNLYIYNKGVYTEVSRAELDSIVKDHLSVDYETASLQNSITTLWITDSTVIKYVDDLNKDEYILNLSNGLYDIKNKELKKHSHKELTTVQIKAKYKEDLEEGKTFNKFIDEIVPNEDTQYLLQEILGYSISHLNNAKKSFILYGDSNSGKSTFLNIIPMLVGNENISSVPFHKLSDRFSTANLYNKVSNICSDLPNDSLDDISVFKQLTGGDRVSAEYKGQDVFSFLNKAKLLFGTNDLPKHSGKEDTAFYNRLIILPFNEVIPVKDQDPNLNKKLEKESDYIFSWALEGLERLIDNNMEFTLSDEVKAMLEGYKVSKVDNTINIIQEMIELGFLQEHYHYKYSNNKTELALYTMGIYKELLDYSKEYLSEEDRKLIYLNRSDFQKAIRNENYFLDYKPVNIGGKTKRCYVVQSNNLSIIQ